MKKTWILAEAFALLVLLQAVRIGCAYFLEPFMPETEFARRMLTAGLMGLLTVAVVLYARWRKTPLSVFPHPFGKWYWVATGVAIGLLVSAPSNYMGGYQPVLLAVYGSVVTPVYEEVIFRGYLWNRLQKVCRKETQTYLWSVLLFTVWHLGYMVSQVAAGNWVVVAWKLAAGVGYGMVLGWIRLKTKNCYATMLAHGILNLFMV